MTSYDDRAGARNAARLHGMLREVRNAPKDARDFLVFDRRDDWKNLGVGDDHIAAVDLTDDDALDDHIAQAGALARALGHVDENDMISGGEGQDTLIGGAGNDRLVSVTGAAQQAGLRGRQLPGAAVGGTGLGAAAIAPRAPDERFVDELKNSYRNSLFMSGVGNLYRKTLPPAEHVANVSRMNAEADAYEAYSKFDPPRTSADRRAEFGGKALGFIADPLAVGGTLAGAELLGAKLAARLAAKPILSAVGAAGIGAGMAGLGGWKQRLLDDWNERE